MKILLKILIAIVFIFPAGCAMFRDGFTTRFGLANPEYPLVSPTPTDETYSGGAVGQQYIEEYDKKYHEKTVLPSSNEPAPEERDEDLAE
jgi:hypothetical protein